MQEVKQILRLLRTSAANWELCSLPARCYFMTASVSYRNCTIEERVPYFSPFGSSVASGILAVELSPYQTLLSTHLGSSLQQLCQVLQAQVWLPVYSFSNLRIMLCLPFQRVLSSWISTTRAMSIRSWYPSSLLSAIWLCLECPTIP